MSGSRASLLRALLAMLRVAFALVALELSGVAGVVVQWIDLTEEDSGGCCSDCPLEKSGRECPPGCPSCHCAHASAALPPAMAAPSASAFDPHRPIGDDPVNVSLPRAPVLPGVFRPPRVAPLSA